MDKSTLFLANVSVVDHAYIDDRGCLVGGSFNPSFEITGAIESQENVVIDFSTVKKRVKRALDDREFGLDHKLWIYSNSEAVVEGTRVTTPYLTIEGDPYFVARIDGEFHSMGSSGMAMGRKVSRELKEGNFKVRCINNKTSHCYKAIDKSTVVSRPVFFRYAHGLRDSTSWACQNIAHGHLSYLQLIGPKDNGFEDLARNIAVALNESIFVWEDNVTTLPDGSTHVEYESRDRGVWRMTIKPDIPQKVVILPYETTIEHLTHQIAQTAKAELLEAGVERILISEGLSKGSLLNVKDL